MACGSGSWGAADAVFVAREMRESFGVKGGASVLALWIWRGLLVGCRGVMGWAMRGWELGWLVSAMMSMCVGEAVGAAAVYGDGFVVG